MKVLAPFFAILASCATIFAAIVRLWWSKPKQLTMRGQPAYDATGEPMQVQPRAPSWLQTTAKWWLRVVVFGLTIGALVILIFIAVRIVELSS